MTKEEIKETYSMADILNRYGLKPDRRGFIPCPFHQERTASMKIYKSDYHCYGCGANGDIFDFVMMMDGLPFKEAFEELGGGYGRGFSAQVRIRQAQAGRELENRRQREHQGNIADACDLITYYRLILRICEPLSDLWCECHNRLQYQIHRLEHLTETG